MGVTQDCELVIHGLRFHVRCRDGAGVPFLLLHGLASSCLTWEATAQHVNDAGYPVVAVDQRGHGRSCKPKAGYGFEECTADVRGLIDVLNLQRPILVGQSWGASVALAFAARYQNVVSGLVLVDGGFLLLSDRPGATWEQISVDLKPPALEGMQGEVLAEWLRRMHSDWSDEGIRGAMGSFETLSDGTIRPWLTLDRHMAILKELWQFRPSYQAISVPVLILPAGSGSADMVAQKRLAARRAEAALAHCRVHWFEDTDHDIQVQRSEALARVMLKALDDGFMGWNTGSMM